MLTRRREQRGIGHGGVGPEDGTRGRGRTRKDRQRVERKSPGTSDGGCARESREKAATIDACRAVTVWREIVRHEHLQSCERSVTADRAPDAPGGGIRPNAGASSAQRF